jgi:hypothetical protein
MSDRKCQKNDRFFFFFKKSYRYTRFVALRDTLQSFASTHDANIAPLEPPIAALCKHFEIFPNGYFF